jgi:NTP pyrophosphatase (non-canonical NTP hydrolase)
LLKELGDVLWYLSSITSELGFELDDVARINVEKLNSRMKNTKIHGDGDNR